MLLEVKNLKTHFDVGEGRVARAVDGISFSVQEGRTLGIVGESGCGKSQTAFSIMRLLEKNGSNPGGSEIVFQGEDLLKKTEEEMQQIRGNRIAMIFQEPMTSLNPLYRVGSQLAEPLILHQKMDKHRARKKAVELLKEVGIPAPETRIDCYPHELSGGMKQRIMIAMALACRPRLLIADEPTTALDVTIQAQILALMKNLQQEIGMAIIMITHNMGIVNQIADDVCVMYAGKIAEKGGRDDIFSNMQHPYTRRLLESIPSSSDINFKLHTIPGKVPSAVEPKTGCLFYDRCQERLEKCEKIESPEYHCGKPGHSAFCHLLEPGFSADRTGATKKQPRPKKGKSGKTLISAKRLRTYFPVKKGFLMRVVNHVRAVDDIDIELKQGETLALVGESGCGKTTAGQSILRLVREADGEVLFGGTNVMSLYGKSLKSLRRKMQIVFQDPFSSLSPRMKVGEIVGEGLKIHFPKLTTAERERKVAEVLDTVGLSQKDTDRYPHEFSGGQRQRIAIARALILDPEFIVLDEPTSALDVSVQAQILNLLEEIQIRRNLAYLFITHDLGVVEYIADYVAVMYLGKIVEYAPKAELFRNPRHPYTKTLLDAVPKIGARSEFNRIVGDVPSPMNPPPGCHFHPRCPIAIGKCSSVPPALEDISGTKVSCHRARETSDFPTRPL